MQCTKTAHETTIVYVRKLVNKNKMMKETKKKKKKKKEVMEKTILIRSFVCLLFFSIILFIAVYMWGFFVYVYELKSELYASKRR